MMAAQECTQGSTFTKANTDHSSDDPQSTTEMPTCSEHTMKVESWEVPDVIHWLRTKDLHKFILLFQKHKVNGTDLTELHLPFLESYDHISLEEREILLSEIYNLLNPVPVCVSQEDLTRLTSPVEKRKFYAAIELAQTKRTTLPRSVSNVVIPSSHSGSVFNSSAVGNKPGHKSESGVAVLHCVQDKPLVRCSKSTAKHLPVKSTVFDCVQSFGSQCVRCISVTQEQFVLVTMETGPEGHVIITGVPEALPILHLGDRVLEVNGNLVSTEAMSDIQKICQNSTAAGDPVLLVVLSRSISGNKDGDPNSKWVKLRSLLEGMLNTDPVSPTDNHSITSWKDAELPVKDQLLFSKHVQCLQEEIKRLEDKISSLQHKNEALNTDLEEKDAAIHDLELSLGKAIENLQSTRSRGGKKSRMESVGGQEYFSLTIKALQLEDKTKEEVVESLKEIVLEASKQKWYLDRLISLVVEESPWLLEEVDSEMDNLTLTPQTEEFC